MTDKRSEARRRRVLENPAKRLERLQNLSRSHGDDDVSTSEKSPDDAVTAIDSCKQSNNHDEINKMSTSNEEEHIVSSGTFDSGEVKDDSVVDSYPVMDGLATNVSENKPSWIRKKYRLLVFVLLAWSIYMVVAKEFDYILAFIIGRSLPADVLPLLIPTAFIAVEIQVMIISMFLPKLNEGESSTLLTLALSLSGISGNVLNFIGKITSLFTLFLTDLCVYVFVIVFLKTLDENI